MKSKVAAIVLVVVILIAASISYLALFPSAPTKMGTAKIVVEAQTEAAAGGDFLLQLLQKGHLPGLTTNDHGHFFCNTKPVSYPYSLTFYCPKESDNFTNYYIITRLKKNSAWQLERALQTDSRGQIVQEWAVK
jgi:hypothetical protein